MAIRNLHHIAAQHLQLGAIFATSQARTIMGRPQDQPLRDHHPLMLRPAPAIEVHTLVSGMAPSAAEELIETRFRVEVSGTRTILAVMSSDKAATVRMMGRPPWTLTAMTVTAKYSTGRGMNEDTIRASDCGKTVPKVNQCQPIPLPNSALLSSHPPRPLHQVPSLKFLKSSTPQRQKEKRLKKIRRTSPRQVHPRSPLRFSIESLLKALKWHQGCAK